LLVVADACCSAGAAFHEHVFILLQQVRGALSLAEVSTSLVAQLPRAAIRRVLWTAASGLLRRQLHFCGEMRFLYPDPATRADVIHTQDVTKKFYWQVALSDVLLDGTTLVQAVI
jgi:hypothetical protein